jgi:hypothetical protein
MKQFASVITLLVALPLGVRGATAAIWDVAADFSTTSNPNGAWSYGDSSSLTSPIALYATTGSVDPANPQVFYWYDASTVDGNQNPNAVGKNMGAPANVGWINVPSGAFVLNAQGGGFSHATWTAPSSGLYSLSSTFTLEESVLVHQVDTYILANGSILFSQVLSQSDYLNPYSFESQLFLTAGETVDFVVSNPFNGGCLTQLSATISSSVPEPATLLIWSLLGGCGIAIGRWRRKRAA